MTAMQQSNGSGRERTFLTAIWLIMIVATAVSLFSSSDRGINYTVASAVIILIGYIKARLVVMHFMEIRTAPLPWRIFFEAWMLMAVAVISFYHFR